MKRPKLQEIKNRLTAITQSRREVTDQTEAEFLAHAREDIPALLTYIEELEHSIARIREKVEFGNKQAARRECNRALWDCNPVTKGTPSPPIED